MALHFTGEVEQTEFQLIEPGTYAVEMNAEFKKTKGGDDFINCSFKILKEYDKTWGGRIVFDGIYKSKTTGAFNEAKINAILSTIPNAKKDFEDYEELVQYINETKMLIDIDIQDADASVPNSKDRNTVGYLSYKPLDEKAVSAPKEEEPIKEVQNDDLPF